MHPMKPRSLSILLPSSLAIDASDLRSKTAKIGQIARAASVFRADKIVIYRDPDLDETKLIERILNYAETPQYLRKRLFPLAGDLRYAGTIPPLRTPHHPDAEKIEIGDIRVGVVVRVHENGSWVDIGSKRSAFMNVTLKKGERVNVQVTSKKPLKAVPVDDDEIAGYWGYSVARAGTLSGALAPTQTQTPGLRIATSRCGESIDADLLRKIGAESGSEDVLVVFGAPHKGISEIMDEEKREAKEKRAESFIAEFDYTLNTLPDQGTATVRLEEAIVATLAILNLAFH